MFKKSNIGSSRSLAQVDETIKTRQLLESGHARLPAPDVLQAPSTHCLSDREPSRVSLGRLLATGCRAHGAAGRNLWDLPSWCGIFALNVYKLSGLKLSPWPLKHTGFSPSPEFQAVTSGANVAKGDLGIFDFRANHTTHHFIVVDATGDTVTSVEGNVTQPFGSGRFQAIVKRTKFSIQQIR